MTPSSETREAVLERFRVESITEGALRAIARKGAAVTMQDIADESGISKGTLYLYFKDRDELLHRVSEGGLAQLLAKIEDVFAKGLPFDETIRELVLTKLRFFDERRALYRVHFELRFPHGRDPMCDSKKHNPPPEKQLYVDRLTRYFEEQLESKEDAPRLAQFISETVAGLLFRRIPETNGSKLEDDAQFLSDLLLNGLSGRRKKS
ncbi:MAG: TetR/AcrR family transcriptional regulator [Vicinamibacteria bacterium]|nr:TetR/AcrR family transcriptional regulator [Vicinamibacteria bacterium]